jgi:hypothetical protein
MAFKSERHRRWFFSNKAKGTLPSRSKTMGAAYFANGAHDINNFVTPLRDRYGGVSGPIPASEARFFRL